VDVNYGLTEDIHVNGEMPYILGEDAGANISGFGRAALAVKFRILRFDNFQIAIHPALEFPPLPIASVDSHGDFHYYLPVVFDFALGHTASGIGIQVSRSINQNGQDDIWGGILGIAGPIKFGEKLMMDFSEEIDSQFKLGEGWLEISYVRNQVFGIAYVNLLSTMGISTIGNFTAMLGLQLSL
jgi:hypothetical protein